MKSVSLLHLGDVHYPRAKNRLGMVDVKDTRFPGTLLRRVAPHPLGKVMNELRSIVENRVDVVGILISGDLTTGADMSEYRACVAYLKEFFEPLSVWREEFLHVVPGNHDVDRSRVPVPSPTASATVPVTDSLEKFEEIQRAWIDAGLPILAVDQVRKYDVLRNDCGVAVFSINSCLGCGEYRRVPEAFQKTYARILARAKRRGVPLATDVLDRLDTPAFDDDHLSEITGVLASTNPFVPAVVLGHHGLLPQAYPRVDIYTEVINGGVARFRLASCQNPVLYCHGHIHESPIEIVTQPDGGGRPLVLVAAPELDAGFNLLTFYYTASGMVLGCEVVRYETRSHGGVAKAAPIRIPLGDRDSPEYASDNVSVQIGNVLPRDSERFPPFLARVREGIPGVSENEVADRLAEMEWLGVVTIESRLHHHTHWQIRRRVG